MDSVAVKIDRESANTINDYEIIVRKSDGAFRVWLSESPLKGSFLFGRHDNVSDALRALAAHIDNNEA